jgi:hypothetical protein
MRKSTPAPIRARLRQARRPDRHGRYPMDIVIDGVDASFPANAIDVVLRELLKVREIIA